MQDCAGLSHAKLPQTQGMLVEIVESVLILKGRRYDT
jgi:hypothetical protein